LWDEEEKEWRPQMRDAPGSSDEEGEAAFLEYHAKLTDKKLVGKVSCELSGRTYGASEWWVLVEKEGPGPAGPGPSSSAARGRGRGRERGRGGARA
jgi:hypothetical protein